MTQVPDDDSVFLVAYEHIPGDEKGNQARYQRSIQSLLKKVLEHDATLPPEAPGTPPDSSAASTPDTTENG